MFTGIISHCGQLKKITEQTHSRQLEIQSQFEDLQEGESVAVNGCCLTVIQPQAGNFRCDLSPETLALTTAKNWLIGDKLNLERALRPMDRMGGHFVTGHIDQIAFVKKIQMDDDFVAMWFTDFPIQKRSLLVPKGSIAINGVSLTINQVISDKTNTATAGIDLQVMLIPHTLERTNLHQLKEGDRVNIEYDMLVKSLVNHLDQVRTA
jgi:riboflavin synthase